MIRHLSEQILSHAWRTLKALSFEYKNRKGAWTKAQKEVYDIDDAAVILLYHPTKRTVILNHQLRIATYLNGNPTGMMLETCAGKLEAGEHPETCIKREAEEETGYHIEAPQFLFEAYISPGALTEKLYYFIAPYDESMKRGKGGGLEEEGEEIETRELAFDTAFDMILSGEIRDTKTIALLQYAKLNEHVLFER